MMTEPVPRRTDHRIVVVIPCYRVKDHILAVLAGIGPEVTRIYAVDDACPDRSGAFIESSCTDPRVRVLRNAENMGVGGATMIGMAHALDDGADIVVKIDGDGQMDPAFIPSFCAMIQQGKADYCKGNRFFEPEGVVAMPTVRLVGNFGLSFITKLSSGYWQIMDPTNGFFAIHASVARFLPFQKIAKRYFFESDLLFRLNVLGAVVMDIPMHAHYGDEVSQLRPGREAIRFALAHTRNLAKRIGYNYFIRGFSLASLELVFGLILMLFGTIVGLVNWGGETPATAGTVMLAALPILVGFQLFLSFVNYDIRAVPTGALHPRLGKGGVVLGALRRAPSSHADDMPPIEGNR